MLQFQFTREAALTSDLIAWFSHGGGFSHVDAVSGPHGQLYGARSDRVGGHPPGVHMRPANYAFFVRRMIIELPCTPEQQKAFWEFLWEQNGKPYDWRAIWAFAMDRDWRAPDAWICSELQMAALEHAGIVHPAYIPTARITPRDVALVISALGGTIILDESHLT